MKFPAWFGHVVLAIVLVTGLLPIALYWWLFGRTPTLSVEQALFLLNDRAQNALVVDVRSPAEFAAMHVDGSVNWPAEQIAAANDLPVDMQGQTLLLVCNSGLLSARAARQLTEAGVERAFYVRGGIQKWMGAAVLSSVRSGQVVYARAGESIAQSMPMFEQVSAVISGFGFKPIHMLLSAALAWLLLRQKSLDLRIFGAGLAAFLAAEVFCAINYLFYDHDSYLAEYLHSYGMTLAFGICAFALVHALDERVLRVSAPGKACALLPLCKGCVKRGQRACSMRTLLQLVTGATAVLAFLPLLAPSLTDGYSANILGTPYFYCRLLLGQYFESRYLPLLTLTFCVATFLALQADKRTPVPLLARTFAAGALATLGFSLFRLALGATFSHALIWADFWEEATELMFVGFSALLVWLYRDGLLEKMAWR